MCGGRLCRCSALPGPSLEDDTTARRPGDRARPPRGLHRCGTAPECNRTSLTAAPPGKRGSGNLRWHPDGTPAVSRLHHVLEGREGLVPGAGLEPAVGVDPQAVAADLYLG